MDMFQQITEQLTDTREQAIAENAPDTPGAKADDAPLHTVHPRAIAHRMLKQMIAAVNGRMVRVQRVTTEEKFGRVHRVIIDFD
jgi:hypothetical protein